MILTENKLKELTLAADVLSEAHQQTRFFSIGQHASVFLSHKHDETESYTHLTLPTSDLG